MPRSMTDSGTDQRRLWKNYLIAGLAAMLFWLTSAVLQGAFHDPADFAAFLLPRSSGELWMRLLLCIIVAFCAINQLDRDARLQQLEREMRDLQETGRGR